MRFTWSLILISALASASALYATGVAVTPSEITLDNIPVGQAFDLSAVSAFRFVVENRSAETNDIRVEILPPIQDRLRAGFEPIPDVSWVRPVPQAQRNVPPGGKADVYFVITVPNDERYLGRKYQFMMKVSIGSSGVSLGAGATVCFTVATNRYELDAGTDAGSRLAFVMIPPDVTYSLKAGMQYALSNLQGEHVIISNPNATACSFVLQSVHVAQNERRLREGYSPEMPSEYLSFATNTISIPARGCAEVPLQIAIPRERRYFKKHFAFVLRATIIKGGIIESQECIVYVDVKR